MIRTAVALAAALAMAGLAIGCGDDGEETEQTSFELVIGDSIPLTGTLSELGEPSEKAADLAVLQINEAIADAGVDHAVEIAHSDNASDPATADEAARRLIESDGASCIIGTAGDDQASETAEQVSIPEKVLQITSAATGDDLSTVDDGGLVDRTTPPASNQGRALAEEIADDLGGATGRTVNVAATNVAGGQEVAESFIEDWTERGGVVGAQVIYSPLQDSYSTQAQELTEGEPEAYVIVDRADTFAPFAESLQATGWDPATAWGTDALLSEQLAAESPDLIEGLRALAPGTPKGEEASAAFNELYRSAEPTGVKPTRFVAQQFDATILCYLAAVAAGSGDGREMARALIDNTAPGGEQFSWEELPDAIEALQAGEDIDYVGASGEVDLDENGDATAGAYDVYRYEQGRLAKAGQLPVPEPKGVITD